MTSSTPPASGPNEHWTKLWKAGVLHSCNAAMGGNYDGSIRDFWTMQFNAIGPGKSVLDLGTGNGALLLLARETWPDLVLHGIDSAQIDPARDMQHSRIDYRDIHFHPGCSMEAMPFADGSMQLVTSQYAFEYATLPTALAEVLRVLDPERGRIAMAIHSDHSEIAKMTARQLQGLELIFGQLGMFDKAMRLSAGLLQKMQGGPDNAENARLEFNTAAQAMMSALSAPDSAPVIDKAGQLLQSALSHLPHAPAMALESLVRGREQLLHEHKRLQEMAAATYDRPRLDALIERLRGTGMQVEPGVLQQAGMTMGWTLVAHRG